MAFNSSIFKDMSNINSMRNKDSGNQAGTVAV